MNNQSCCCKNLDDSKSLIRIILPQHWQRLIVLSILLTALIIAAPAQAAFPPNQQTGLKILLLSADNSEPTTGAWETTLQQEGVPYDKIVVNNYHANNQTLTNSTFGSFDPINKACTSTNYEAVIVATGGLIYNNNGTYVSALSTNEWSALNSFEATCGIRQITAYTYPTPDYGLNYPTTGEDLSGVTTTLTVNGLAAFPYLKGTVPIDTGTWGYLATPLSNSNFTTFLLGPNNSSLIGIFTHTDTRQEMVVTIGQNPYQLQRMLLHHGMLNWLTNGVYLGLNRNYLEMHVDDIFIYDNAWDTTAHATLFNTSPIRMTAADVVTTVNWQAANNFTFDLSFNAIGVQNYGGVANDPLTQALLTYKNKFYWRSHTYSHLNLDNLNNTKTPVQLASVSDIQNQIDNNVNFAKTNKLPRFDKTEVVSAAYSGLYNNYQAPPGYQPPWPGNPNMGTALEASGVLWAASNNPVSPLPYTVPCTSATENPPPYSNSYTFVPASAPVIVNGITINPGTAIGDANLNSHTIDTSNGPATVKCTYNNTYTNPVWTVPRYPTNVYYDCSTQAQQLDEYNYYNLPPTLGGICTSHCLSAPATWDTYVATTALQILKHVLSNDPRSHYAHQTNLTADGILLTVMKSLLDSYNFYIKPNSPLQHLTLAQIGQNLLQMNAWNNAISSGSLSGYIQNGTITLKNNGPVSIVVPVTGVSGGIPYGGQYSAWEKIAAGTTLNLIASP